MLLALEGIAGAGKSTLRDRLLSAAAAEDLPAAHLGQFSWLSLQSTRSIIALRAGQRGSTAEQALAAVRHDLELHAQHNLLPALAHGAVIADRLMLSSACLLALLYGQPVGDYVRQLTKATTVQPDLTVLLTTPPEVCHSRLSDRETVHRFGDSREVAAQLTSLYDQAATTWNAVTGLPVLRHPCTTSADIRTLTAACLDHLRAAYPAAARP